jgi:hypothetical protein
MGEAGWCVKENGVVRLFRSQLICGYANLKSHVLQGAMFSDMLNSWYVTTIHPVEPQ